MILVILQSLITLITKLLKLLSVVTLITVIIIMTLKTLTNLTSGLIGVGHMSITTLSQTARHIYANYHHNCSNPHNTSHFNITDTACDPHSFYALHLS